MPVVAPVTNTMPCSATRRPICSAFSAASFAQWPVSAAPETQILYFRTFFRWECLTGVDFVILQFIISQLYHIPDCWHFGIYREIITHFLYESLRLVGLTHAGEYFFEVSYMLYPLHKPW